jgi:hypothetical protein
VPDVNPALLHGLIELAASLAATGALAVMHSKRFRRVEADAARIKAQLMDTYQKDVPLDVREVIAAFVQEVRPAVLAAVNGDLTAAEKEALARATKFSASIGSPLPAADILAAVQKGLQKTPTQAAAEVLPQAAAAVGGSLAKVDAVPLGGSVPAAVSQTESGVTLMTLGAVPPAGPGSGGAAAAVAVESRTTP